MGRTRDPEGRLPRRTTSFVGREDDVAALERALAGAPSLVTIVGIGGAGKTRLACEAAARIARALELGIVFVDLSDARGPGDLASLVAAAASVPIDPNADPASIVDRVARKLETAPSLVLLDNFETVRAGGAELALALATRGAARVLVTSREALFVDGEARHPIGPLAPADAAILFADRARAMRRDVTIEEPLVRSIVDRLDGHPLAIELAASRIEALSPRRILEGLDRRFELLRTTRKGVPARHAALEAVLDGAWEALDPPLQVALARLSSLRGFDLDAAGAIVDGEPLAVIEELLRRALLVVRDGGDDTRYAIPENVREHARERIGGGERALAEQRIAEHLVPRAERWARVDLGFEAPADLARLEIERENLLAIVDRTSLDPALRARAALALDALLVARGPFHRHLPLLDAALAACGDGHPALTARLSIARGRARWIRGELSEDDFARALALAEHDPLARVEALRMLALAHADVGRIELALEESERALEGARALGLVETEGTCLATSMVVLDRAGRPWDAALRGETAIEIHRRTGNTRAEGIACFTLAMLLLDLGHVEEGRARFARALELLEGLGERRFVGLSQLGIALSIAGDGIVPEAEALFDVARATFDEVGDRRNVAIADGYEGLCRLAHGAPGAAERLSRAVAFTDAHGASGRATLFVAALAVQQASEHAREIALRNLERARAVIEERGDTVERAALAAYASIVLARPPEIADAPDALELRLARAAAARLAPPRAPALAGTLEIGPGFAWARAGTGATIELARRDAPRRIVERLVAHREAGAAEPLLASDLVEAGWPGEKMLPEAGTARVYTAIRTLRRLGLDDVIRTRGRGYELDPALAIVRR